MKAITVIREHRKLPFEAQQEQRALLYEKLHSFDFEELEGELQSRLTDEEATDVGEIWPLVTVLAQKGDSRAFDPICHLLQERSHTVNRVKDLIIRQAAIRALGILSDRRAVTPLIEVLYSDNGILAVAAAEALIKIGDPVAIKDLQIVHDIHISESQEENLYPAVAVRLSHLIRILEEKSRD